MPKSESEKEKLEKAKKEKLKKEKLKKIRIQSKGPLLSQSTRYQIRGCGKAMLIPDGATEVFEIYDSESKKVLAAGTEKQVADWFCAQYMGQIRQMVGIMCGREKNLPHPKYAGRHIAVIHQSWVVERRTDGEGKRILALMTPEGKVIASGGSEGDIMAPMVDRLVGEYDPVVTQLKTNLIRL